jgi:hypothetical protein
MSFGAGLGFGVYGLYRISTVFTSGGFTVPSLILSILFLAGLYWAWRTFPGFQEELMEVNRSGMTLAWFAVVIVLFAVCLSAYLLLSG